MSDDENDPFWPPYKVGYKNPPRSRRFTKGKSGNPRGRPPKKKPDPNPHIDKSTMESVLKVASRGVTIQDGENLTKLPTFDVVLQKLANTAMKGSVPAQKAFIELVDRIRKEQAAEVKNDHAFWRDYLANYDKHTEAMQKAGHQIPEDWPHTDDLVFEEGQYVMIRGRSGCRRTKPKSTNSF